MLSVEEAQTQVLAAVTTLASEECGLAEALYRVLAADTMADLDLPPFTNSSMDGYALRASDTAGAGPNRPSRLPVPGEVAAGDPGTMPVPLGAALRIMTGAPMPPGADAVVPVEQTRPGAAWVDILSEIAAGGNVRLAGEDARRGQPALPAGTVLHAGEIGLLASFGYARVAVYRRPTVAILSTGNELVPIEDRPGPGQIRNSNAVMLGAQVLAAAATPLWLPTARDTKAAVQAALDAAQGADLIVSSGGVSVGEYDVVRQVLEDRGDLDFWRVRMRPGKPFAFGTVAGIPFLGLPGNPVAAFVTFELFVRPALRKMAGHEALTRRPVSVRLDDQVPSGHERRHYVRAVARWEDDGWHAVTTGAQGSHLLRSTVSANALIMVPEGSGDLAAGSCAQALLLDWPESP